MTQEKDNKSKRKSSGSADALQWAESDQQLQQLDSMEVEFDLEHGFGTPLTGGFATDSNTSLLLSPDLNLLIDEIGGARVDTNIPEEDPNALFAQTPSTALTQPPYRTLPFEPPPSARRDSGYAGDITAGSSIDRHIPPSSHSVFTSAEPSCCSCLQQQVQLVYQLEDLQYSHANGPPIDCILRSVQMAQTPWKSLMECSRCQSQDNQKEVFLLFAMSIRILLSAVQRLSTNTPHADVLLDAAMCRASSGASDVEVSVGSFELTGETKAKVVAVALQGALRSVTSALLHLWGRTGRPSRLPSVHFANRNSTHINTVALERSVDILTTATEESPKLPERDASPLPSLDFEDTGTLLEILQCTMQAMKQDKNACG